MIYHTDSAHPYGPYLTENELQRRHIILQHVLYS